MGSPGTGCSPLLRVVAHKSRAHEPAAPTALYAAEDRTDIQFTMSMIMREKQESQVMRDMETERKGLAPGSVSPDDLALQVP